LKNKLPTSRLSAKAWQSLARMVAFSVVIGLTVYILLLPEDRAERLSSYGYVGVFLISILANATIIIPAPGILIVMGMAVKFNPLLVATIAGFGATIGELSGYLAGFSGQGIIENQLRYEQVVKWMEKNGPLTITILAFIPNPLFDVAGMIAGAFRMPVLKFLFFALIGKLLKMILVAYLGAGILNAPWLEKLMAP